MVGRSPLFLWPPGSLRTLPYRGLRSMSLPPSELYDHLVRMPTPCQQHIVFYPGRLAQEAIDQQAFHVFHTICECGTAYVVALQADGAHFRKIGSPEAIVTVYESLEWPERVVEDPGEPPFFCKVAPSPEALAEALA
jgi:hypothetical protein